MNCTIIVTYSFIGLLLFSLIKISILSCDDNGALQLSVIGINRHGNITLQDSKRFYFSTINPISFKGSLD